MDFQFSERFFRSLLFHFLLFGFSFFLLFAFSIETAHIFLCVHLVSLHSVLRFNSKWDGNKRILMEMYVNRSKNDISIHSNQNFYWNPQLNVKYALMDEQRSPTVFMNKITTCAINLILFQLVLSIIRLLNNEKIVLIHAKKTAVNNNIRFN